MKTHTKPFDAAAYAAAVNDRYPTVHPTVPTFPHPAMTISTPLATVRLEETGTRYSNAELMHRKHECHFVIAGKDTGGNNLYVLYCDTCQVYPDPEHTGTLPEQQFRS